MKSLGTDKLLHHGAAEYPGKIEVESGSQHDPHEGVDKPQASPKDVAGGELRDFARNYKNHDLGKLQTDAQQRPGEPFPAERPDQFLFVCNLVKNSRAPKGIADSRSDGRQNYRQLPFLSVCSHCILEYLYNSQSA